MDSRLLLLSIAALTAIGALAPSSAEACSPSGDVWLVGPDPANPIPANAAIRLHGGWLDAETIVATVDDAPATLVELPELFRFDYAWEERGYLVDGLLEGQHVVVSWCYGDSCVDLIEYDAAAPQDEPPAPPASLLFDLHDYPDTYGFGPACQSSEQVRWWIKTETNPPTTDLELFYVFEGVDAADGETVLFSRYFEVFDPTEQVVVPRFEPDGIDVLEGMCVRGYALDSAGHTSDALEVCLPCRYSTAEAVTDGEGLPVEPMWTQGDIYPDGPCALGVPPPWDPGPPDPGGDGTTGGDESGGDETGDPMPPSDSSGGSVPDPGTTGGSDSDGGSAGADEPLDRGCACRADGGSDGVPILGLMGVLVLIGRRRRTS